MALRPGESYDVGGQSITLTKVHDSSSLRVPVVSLNVGGDRPERVMLPLSPASSEDLAFVDIEPASVVTLQERYNPSVPLVLVVAGLLTIGVVLVGWERVRRG